MAVPTIAPRTLACANKPCLRHAPGVFEVDASGCCTVKADPHGTASEINAAQLNCPKHAISFNVQECAVPKSAVPVPTIAPGTFACDAKRCIQDAPGVFVVDSSGCCKVKSDPRGTPAQINAAKLHCPRHAIS